MKASCIPVYNLDQRGFSSTNWRVGRTSFPLNGLVTTHQGRLGRRKALCFLYSGVQHSSKFRKILYQVMTYESQLVDCAAESWQRMLFREA